ncbi:SipW-dependent-type signal peptide-containing protein [Halorubrum sp. DTA46]|uniref:SipW-dependent-type signal peptide-containing protein n=1 Tax=Halorubrum sp. DTA46 TaxID=3402162 RepID=UPI003AAF0E93
MTDTNSTIGLSRRKVLAGLGAVGVASAGAGLGTTAYFSDRESFEGNAITAGQLDLSVTWQQLYYGGPQSSRAQDYGSAERPFVNAYPDSDGNGLQSFERGDGVHEYVDLDAYDDPEEAAKAGRNLEFACSEIATFDEPSFGPNEDALIELDDVKPGDCGEITFGVKLCDNPGYIWLQGLLQSETSGDHPDGEEGVPQLADEIVARAWYDDGDNVFDEGEPQIVSGTLREVLDALRDGTLLTPDPMPVEPPEALIPDDADVPIDEGAACTPLPKEDDGAVIDGLAAGDTFEYTLADGTAVVITLTDVTYKDDEPIGFAWSSTVPICQVTLKGGPEGIAPGEGLPTLYDCETSGSVATTLAPGGEPYAISNFRFYVCAVGDDGELPPAENGGACFQPSNTSFIGFEWCLPTTVGNEVQGDSLSFDLSFYTEQCRHNADPENPFANGAAGSDSDDE